MTAPSLYEFIARQVNYPSQQPVFFGGMSGLIVLMHYPERAAAKVTSAKPKVASPQSKGRLNSNRTWVMLGDHFFRADKVRHALSGTLHLLVTTGSGEDQATFAGLRPDRYGGRSSLPFASGNDAHLVRVQSVDSERLWNPTGLDPDPYRGGKRLRQQRSGDDVQHGWENLHA